jgi:hypothetical protein
VAPYGAGRARALLGRPDVVDDALDVPSLWPGDHHARDIAPVSRVWVPGGRLKGGIYFLGFYSR